MEPTTVFLNLDFTTEKGVACYLPIESLEGGKPVFMTVEIVSSKFPSDDEKEMVGLHVTSVKNQYLPAIDLSLENNLLKHGSGFVAIFRDGSWFDNFNVELEKALPPGIDLIFELQRPQAEGVGEALDLKAEIFAKLTFTQFLSHKKNSGV
jgi:hypothetical protein